jgi:DNA topoisomerase-3
MKGIAKFVKDPALRQVLKDATGIGTEATRASIIEGLITRGYLLKQGRRALRASSAAFTLIDAIPEILADPVTSALWEHSLSRIATRQMSLEEFVRQQSAWVSRIVQDYAHTTLPLHGSRR